MRQTLSADTAQKGEQISRSPFCIFGNPVNLKDLTNLFKESGSLFVEALLIINSPGVGNGPLRNARLTGPIGHFAT